MRIMSVKRTFDEGSSHKDVASHSQSNNMNHHDVAALRTWRMFVERTFPGIDSNKRKRKNSKIKRETIESEGSDISQRRDSSGEINNPKSQRLLSDSDHTSALGNLTVTVNRIEDGSEERNVTLDNSTDCQIIDTKLHGNEDVNHCVVENVTAQGILKETQECTACFDHSYILFKGLSSCSIASLQSEPPAFFDHLLNFQKTTGHLRNIIHCKVCNSGAMSCLANLIEHLKGKTHKKRLNSVDLAGDNSILKIILCNTCLKVHLYISASDDQCQHWELPPDISKFLRRKSSLPDEESTDHKPACLKPGENIKPSKEIHLVFSRLSEKDDFSFIFEEIAKYGKEHNLELVYICVVPKGSQKSALCRFRKERDTAGQDSLKYVYINKRRIAVEKAKPEQFHEGIAAHKKDCDPGGVIDEWQKGSLSPPCHIFGNLRRLDHLISSKLLEMRLASQDFDRLVSILCNNLWKTFKNNYSVQSIDFFGSRVTGLALKDSDFDLQISTGHPCSVRTMASRCFSPELYFNIKEVIPWAKVPIIKLQHILTGVKCDLSLNNLNGVINSKLLRFYLDIDERVRWLVVTVKMWALMNHINGSFTFTSYGLAWLVIFFLMQQGISLVPVVRHLTLFPCQDLRKMIFSLESGKGFALDMDMLRRSHNPKTKCHMNNYELLCSFFKFCIDLDTSPILDPFTGNFIDRKVLFANCQGNPPLSNLKSVSAISRYTMILLDPINHSVNVCPNVKGKLVNDLKKLSQETLELLTRSSSK